jgi:hypothetical protein
VIRKNLLRKAALAVSVAALPLGMAVTIAAPASAGPDVCVGGPFGYAYACVDTPGWVGWYDDDGGRGRGNGHWKHGHH